MRNRLLRLSALAAAAAAAVLTVSSSVAVSSSVQARYVTSRGWVQPGETYPFTIKYVATDASTAVLTVRLPASAYFVSSSPPPDSSSISQATYDVAGLSGQIVVNARAATLVEDPEVIWKKISATAELLADGQTYSSMTNGPRVTELESAKFGDRPFPVINVQYQDVKHCTAPGVPFSECLNAHPVSKVDEVMNSRTSGRSVWQHYNDISLGQLNPQGTVAAAGKGTVPFTGSGQHKFARLAPNGACTGATQAGPGADGAGTGGQDGRATYLNRIEDGWYLLPGTQTFYGSDRSGHALAGALTGVGLLFGIDDACGPTGKLAYDAASLADPDLDYNDFDSDRNGLVDFFEIIFAGDGGHGRTTRSGINNVWPHSSSVEYYFSDANGQKGYVSNDQLRNLQEQPLWWTDATRTQMTTSNLGDALKVYVRVGPYNVNEERSFDRISVLSHEYGHSLGLPDFYSFGSRSTFGGWELMATDQAQFMTGYTRQKLGWIVPQTLTSGEVTLRESKFDTQSIKWRRPDGTPYELSGPEVHNADLFRVRMPNAPLIDTVPDGVQAAFSGKGNNFNCPPEQGHGLLINLPDMQLHGDATAATLKFKTLYEMEWDYDYGFVLVSTDGGETWTSLSSKKGTTISNFNPNNGQGPGPECNARWNNSITGVSGRPNTTTNPDRVAGSYPAAAWIDDEYDLTPYKGQQLLVLLGYCTDPALLKRGWFVDSLSVSAAKSSGSVTLYETSFEASQASQDRSRLFPQGKAGWSILSTADGGSADHSYYLELRDRISWDFNGNGQNDRGPISWQPGVSMVYTNEATGYGNTDGANPPHQTPVDAAPQPGNQTPVLDDAAFNLARPNFNGCTHIDNYVDPDGPDEHWKMPDSLKFAVTDITGLSTDGNPPVGPATVTLIAELNPNCDLEIAAPELSIGADYEDPDTDGVYTLSWTRPVGAVGPDTLQEATVFSILLQDNAESGLGKWVTTTTSAGSFAWQASGAKTHGGANSFWGRNAEGAANTASLLTSKDPLAVPTTGSTTLSFWDFHVNEGDDSVVLEVTADNGGTWETLHQAARSALAPDAAIALESEPMVFHEFDLAEYAGQMIKLRFRVQAGPENRAGSTPFGWYVDDIKIETNNFAELLTTADTSAELVDKPAGTYYYRVNTRYPAGPTATIASPWSNIVTATVDINLPPVADAGADFSINEGQGAMLSSGANTGDPNGDTLSYAWTQVSGPSVALANADTATASFTTPAVCSDTPLVFRLTVSDPGGLSHSDEITVTVQNINAPPVANAGADFTVDGGQSAMLSAAGSTDADTCQTLSYAWTQTSGPSVALANASTATPSFTAPSVNADTPLTFHLSVRDSSNAEGGDDIVVTVRPPAGPSIGNNSPVGGLGPGALLLLVLASWAARRRRARVH